MVTEPEGGKGNLRPVFADGKISRCYRMTEQSQHAIRRSTRLPLEVPIRVTSLDAATPFSEDCNTTLVNAHGCGLIAKQEIPRGRRVRLEIVSARRHTTAVVSEMVPLGGDPETWLIGLELDVPGNFWGIDYAPADWKIDEVPTSSKPKQPERTEKAGHRWRLTDISTGACYLETVDPFPEGTPVLLSVRASKSECLLDGMVRISHQHSGMGVEFTNPEQKRRVEELIVHLTETREVPKIFVGRKEGRQKAEALRQPAQRGDTEAPDPLLELVREGPNMSAEEFLSDLRAQRLGKRRDPRIDTAISVLLTGVDESGRPLDQRVITMNVSRRGAQLQGVHGRLRPGDRVALARGAKKEMFRVAWVGAENSPVDGQIGISSIEANSNFWDEILEMSAPAQE